MQDAGWPGVQSPIDRFRVQMRRFEQAGFALPVAAQSECGGCGEVVAAEFVMAEGRVVLEKRCPQCGQTRECTRTRSSGRHGRVGMARLRGH